MKKVWSVIYSNKKIPQGQTMRIFDILLTRSLWKHVPRSFILLWIYSRIRLIFHFIDLTNSNKSFQVHNTLLQLWYLAELVWNFKSKFCWYSLDKMNWKETLIRRSYKCYTLHNRTKTRYLADRSMF